MSHQLAKSNSAADAARVFELALRYLNGVGVAVDEVRAIELLELAKRACKRLRLNDATAELDEDGLKICEAAWYATRARRGALACQMRIREIGANPVQGR